MKKQHTESRIQQACVRWFRYQYPHLSTLLFHPKNEGHGDRIAGAIAKAEGVVPGVPDLILALPNASHSMLCLELKTPKGRQSESQKLFQTSVEAATAQYNIIRDIDTFIAVVDAYMASVDERILASLKTLHYGNEIPPSLSFLR